MTRYDLVVPGVPYSLNLDWVIEPDRLDGGGQGIDHLGGDDMAGIVRIGPDLG
jgi:hypothetical protein